MTKYGTLTREPPGVEGYGRERLSWRSERDEYGLRCEVGDPTPRKRKYRSPKREVGLTDEGPRTRKNTGGRVGGGRGGCGGKEEGRSEKVRD